MNKIDKNYNTWLKELKDKVKQAQQRAFLSVNQEMLNLYWNLGKEITEKIESAKYGDNIVRKLSKDLNAEFPNIKGFSTTNLKYMRNWYKLYNSSVQKGLHPADLFTNNIFNIPWTHNTVIIDKTSTLDEAIFYVSKTLENSWSRNILTAQIESNLFTRTGKTLNNFSDTLPPLQSDLANETFKSPYIFDFLNLNENIKEVEFEKQLINNIKKFLLELGKGFAFIGNQYKLNIAGDDFFIDLLFFNIELNCYVVFELKIGEFKPEFAGKLNFYVNVINGEVKKAHHNPTIGVLLCKTPNETVIEYSIKNMNTAIGISQYEMATELPKELQNAMPSIQELQDKLGK